MSANPFEKPTVDANIYQRESAKQQVDWKQIAADVTKTVTAIETDRTNRKAAIKKSYDDQQKELRSLTNKYDSVTLQQRVNDGANQMSEQIAAQYDLVLRGQLKPSEFGLIQQNVATGFEGIKSYADNFETQFDEFTKRSQIQKNGETINSKEERYDAELLLSFSNLNNKIFRAGDDGIVSVLTVDDSGVPIEGQSATVQQLNALLYQKTDNMNLTGILGNINKQLGEVVLADAAKKNQGYTNLTTTQINRAEIDFAEALNDEQNEKAQQLLNDKVDVMLSDDAKVATFAANFVSTTNEGGVGDVQYSLGSKEDIAKWNADPDNKGKQLPIILREFNKNSGLVQSFPTPEQTKLIREAAKRAIIGSFSVSVEEDIKKSSNRNYSYSKNLTPEVKKLVDPTMYLGLTDAFYSINNRTTPAELKEITRRLEQKLNQNNDIDTQGKIVANFIDDDPYAIDPSKNGRWIVSREAFTSFVEEEVDGEKVKTTQRVPARKLIETNNVDDVLNLVYKEGTGKENYTQAMEEKRSATGMGTVPKNKFDENVYVKSVENNGNKVNIREELKEEELTAEELILKYSK